MLILISSGAFRLLIIFFYPLFIYLNHFIMNKKISTKNRTGRTVFALVPVPGGMIAARRVRSLLLSLLLCAALPFAVQAQNLNVSGTVLDSKSEPVAGASVVVKGTSVGAMTDANGGYTISAPADATLVFSFLGLATKEEAIAGRGRIDVVLSESDQYLEEVVVVGYGVQKKANLTGAVSTISSERLENRAVPNVSSALAGLAAGVSVRQGQGTPGSDGATIRVRGLGTFSGDYQSPMVIIDGATGSLDLLNPEDIESMSILKDAASAAIYGSRAANGVILVTTKKGKKGETPRVSYSAVFASEKPSSKFELMSDYAEYMDMANRSRASIGSTAIYQQTSIDAWREAAKNPNAIPSTFSDGTPNTLQIPNWLAYPNTDWSDVLFVPNFYQKHNLSVTGGSENTSYQLSLNYYDNPGTLENTGQQQFQMRANIETRVAGFIRLGTQTYYTKQLKEQGNLDNVNTYRFQSISGLTPYYNGQYGAAEDPTESAQSNNLLVMLNARGGQAVTDRINSTWFAGVDILKGLSADVRFNYQQYYYDNEAFSRSLDGYSFRTGEVRKPGADLQSATNARTYTGSYQYTTSGTLNYNTAFGDHNVSALLGFEQYYYNTRGFSATKQGMSDFSMTDFTKVSEMYSMGGTPEQDYAMFSYFGRVNYDYQGKYLLEANFRRDGSSRFSPDNRWGTFPSFSAGWRVTEEEFMADFKDVISSLKLRASWGKLGNTTSGYYDWQATYGQVNYSLDGKISNGLAVTSLANSLLQWENVTALGFGLDASFLKNRLSVELDYYNRTTEGILHNPAIPLAMGTASAPYRNTADMRNRGVEITLGWRDKIGEVDYAVNGNFSYNNNKVVKYLGKLEQGWTTDDNGNPVYKTNIGDVAPGSGTTIRVEDRMLDEFYLRKHYSGTGTYKNGDGTVDINGGPKDGMIRTADDLQWVRDMVAAGYSFNGLQVNKNNGLWYGEYIMEDANGDKNYGNTNDRDFTGISATPKYGFGLNLFAAWKFIDFSMTWAGNAGFSYYLHERGFDRPYLDVSNRDVLPPDARTKFYYLALDADGEPIWNDPNNNLTAQYPRLRGAASTGADIDNTAYLYDASYLKLKSLQIGFTVPKKWVEKAHISNLRIYFTAENLLTFTSYPGVDPELGRGLAVYPMARMLAGGLNISF
jgi:TonB-linked SusC/RagA family outer membrane protein